MALHSHLLGGDTDKSNTASVRTIRTHSSLCTVLVNSVSDKAYSLVSLLFTLRGYVTQGDKLMRQPTFVPDQDQLLKDFHGGAELNDVAPDAVSITIDEYLNPQDVRHGGSLPADDDLFSSVSGVAQL